MTFTTINSASGGFTHDLAGKVTSDHVINYVYDQEGRICAVKNTNTGSMTQYVYDAEGQRVAKGTITSWPATGATCAAPTTGNGFTLTNVYLRGLHGDQDTELNGQGALIHTNVFVEGGVTATYWDSPQYGWEWSYEFSDWQGTKRVQVKPGGQLENAWQSDPYNDYMTAIVVGPDATEHHYTQKERDIESGNDYFGARYYTSLMGRFMSPDWSAKVEPVPYAKVGDPQSLNLYAFVGNNPLNHVDIDGHAPLSWGGFEDCSGNYSCNGGGQTAMETWQNRSAQIVDEVAERGGYGGGQNSGAEAQQQAAAAPASGQLAPPKIGPSQSQVPAGLRLASAPITMTEDKPLNYHGNLEAGTAYNYVVTDSKGFPVESVDVVQEVFTNVKFTDGTPPTANAWGTGSNTLKSGAFQDAILCKLPCGTGGTLQQSFIAFTPQGPGDGYILTTINRLQYPSDGAVPSATNITP